MYLIIFVGADESKLVIYPYVHFCYLSVLWDPFEDIVPRQLKKLESAVKVDAEVKPKKKAVK
jgi:peptidyl-prolyl cis-trans isomerase SDCCAG10